MKPKMILKYVLLAACICLFFSCKKNPLDSITTLRGAEINMGNGKANSFFTINSAGAPQEIGMELTADVLTGLSQNPTDFANLTFNLPVDPKVLELTPFDHLAITWAPNGHPPVGRFDVPHFDFYFYIMTVTEQNAIAPYSTTTAPMFETLPPSGYLPSSYMALPGGIPRFGKSWVDAAMSTPLTHAMVYGSYNGKVVLQVPGVTKTILESGVTINALYAQPQNFEKAGKWYPTKYNIYKDNSANKQYVTLSEFVKR